MKRAFYFMSTILVSSTILMGCEEELTEPGKKPASIQFVNHQQTIEEGDGTGTTIGLTLSRAATADGVVKLRISGESWKRLTTIPAHVNGTLALPFASGAQQLQFVVSVVDNDKNDGDEVVEILIEPSLTFTLGEQNTFHLAVTDNDSPAPVQSVANFAEQVESVLESNTDVLEYTILLSKPVAVESKVVIDVTSENPAAFVIQPTPVNGQLALTVPTGSTEVSFTVSMLNNAELNGHSHATFSILSTEGSIIKGTQWKRALTINDDELVGKVRGYESTGASDAIKRFYEYDTQGRIAKVNWETYTPFKRTGTETYFYDEQGRIAKINKYPGRDIRYLWTDGRITRSETFQDNTLIGYATYAYDQNGNVAGVEPYHQQSDGSFKRGLFTVYLYFNDGNIYKALMYTDVPESSEPVLVSTRTYDQYRPENNPVPMVEVIPTVVSQKNLVSSYRIEESSFAYDYTLAYEFRPDGQPSRRIASSARDTQTVLYHYY